MMRIGRCDCDLAIRANRRLGALEVVLATSEANSLAQREESVRSAGSRWCSTSAASRRVRRAWPATAFGWLRLRRASVHAVGAAARARCFPSPSRSCARSRSIAPSASAATPTSHSSVVGRQRSTRRRVEESRAHRRRMLCRLLVVGSQRLPRGWARSISRLGRLLGGGYPTRHRYRVTGTPASPVVYVTSSDPRLPASERRRHAERHELRGRLDAHSLAEDGRDVTLYTAFHGRVTTMRPTASLSTPHATVSMSHRAR